MQDHPTMKELLKGVYQFLERDVVPALEEPERFHTRVAANLLKIIEREIDLESGLVEGEVDRLRKLLDARPNPPESPTREANRLTRELCEMIRAGGADLEPKRTATLDHVRQTLIDKLRVADPGMIDKAQAVY